MPLKSLLNRPRTEKRQAQKASIFTVFGAPRGFQQASGRGPKRHPKNHEKVETEKVSKNYGKGLKRDAKCSRNGFQNLRKSV